MANVEHPAGLQPYSLGIVVLAKEDGSDYIKVNPIEKLSMENGPLKEDKREYDVKGEDHLGIQRTSKLEGEGTVVAKWIPRSSGNRMTAPDVYPGETVELFKYSDDQAIYWDTLFREPGLRRKETVTYGYSNIEGGTEAFDKSSSYWVEISTKEQHIKIHTSKNSGEPCEYDLTIDTGRGILEVKDDLGNYLKIESTIGKATLETTEEIHHKTRRYFVEAEEMELQIANDYTSTVGGNLSETVTGNASRKSTGNNTIESPTSVMLVGGNIVMTGAMLSMNVAGMSGTSGGSMEFHGENVKMTARDMELGGEDSFKLKGDTSIENETPEVKNTGDIRSEGNSYAKEHIDT